MNEGAEVSQVSLRPLPELERPSTGQFASSVEPTPGNMAFMCSLRHRHPGADLSRSARLNDTLFRVVRGIGFTNTIRDQDRSPRCWSTDAMDRRSKQRLAINLTISNTTETELANE